MLVFIVYIEIDYLNYDGYLLKLLVVILMFFNLFKNVIKFKKGNICG